MKPMPTLRSRVFASRSPWRFRPQVEWLESRQQPGETFGFGLLGGALAGTALDLFSLPLGAVPPDQQLVRDYRPVLTREAVEITTLMTLGEYPTSGGENLAATDHQVLPALIQPPTHAGDFDVLLEDMPVLPVSIQRPHVAALSGLKTPSGGSIETAAAVGAWSSATVAVPEAPSGGPTEPDNLSRFVPLGGSAPRLDPNSMAFDPWSGAVAIRGDGADHTIQEALTSRGFVEVSLDGQPHSSDPASTSFDPLLAGATAIRLTRIRLAGAGGQDTLILGAQQLAGGLQVNAPGAKVVTEDVAVGGSLVVQAGDITVRGTLRGSAVALAATGWASVEDTGSVVAGRGDTGGRIAVFADKFVNTGQLHADGATGGQITVAAGNVLNAGSITANGTNGGGTVRISFTGAYIDTVAAVTSANGSDGPGGHVTIEGGTTGRLFSSGRQQATGSVGGTVDLLGRDVVLDGGAVNTSGETGGGSIRVGGDFHGRNPVMANADAVTVTPATTIQADALRTGDGGRVAIWSDADTAFQGAVSARGGPAGGAGGLIEVSGQGSLNYGGTADAGAPSGQNGTLLLDPKNLIIGAAPVGVFPQFDLIDPHPTASGLFGYDVTVITNGNVAVTDPGDNFGGIGAGAAYLFDGSSGALIGSLFGSTANDQVGLNGIFLLTNGNYLIQSQNWNGVGAVTWASGSTGINGIVSPANSLVGDKVGGSVSTGDIAPLNNGNYVVVSYGWNSYRGAVTWGNGTTGMSGVVSASNSLVGSGANDDVGIGGVIALNNGNYLVLSSTWSNARGAVTWGSGTHGVSGPVSDTNSLVGSNPYDLVGDGRITVLNNDNYLVPSPDWNGHRGAVTWASGAMGIHGAISAVNSLVGTSAGDYVGKGSYPDYRGVKALTDGNYVVVSPEWGGSRGAVSWGNGATGVRGPVSVNNSLVGTDPNDLVGGRGIIDLGNGNYVVNTTFWNGSRGAVTWVRGGSVFSGTISAMNSLVGVNPGDSVGLSLTPLSNGNYVVVSPLWNGNRGAVTWGNGTTGISGTVSLANSLIGSDPNDYVGASSLPPSPVVTLSNGNFVVSSLFWSGYRGAVTLGNGSTGVTGVVSASNSLVGSNSNDLVGLAITTLSSGNYIVQSSWWDGKWGAATWESGSVAIVGPVSAANSLVGSDPNDQVGLSVIPLNNGNYVITNPYWNSNRGALTWGDGMVGVRGVVAASNSLVGFDSNNEVGNIVIPLRNGNYAVENFVDGGEAVTWVNGAVPINGQVSLANSLVGFSRFDSSIDIVPLSNGNYVVEDPYWNDQRGAVTWGSGSAGVSGTVSEANSLVGTTPYEELDVNRIALLANGNYLVQSPNWNNQRGAVTWVSGTTGQTLDGRNIVTPQNSLSGQAGNTSFKTPVPDPIQQSFLARFGSGSTARVTMGLTNPNQFTYARGQSQTVTLTPDFLTATLNTGTAVVLQASNDITVDDPITAHANGHGGALTLQAGRSILLNASITTDNGPLTLIANDTRADGVVDSQRDPGNATIVMAGGTSLDTGIAPLDIELRDGAGLTHADSRAINLQTLTAGSATVVNNGPDAGSDLRLGPVTTSGPQTYGSPNGVTTVTADLTTGDSPITFTDSVRINDDVSVNTGSGTVNFAGTGTQSLQTGAGVYFGNLNHTGSGTLQLTSGLAVAGTFLQSAGTFDANDQPVAVSGAAILTGGTYLAGTAPQTFAGGLVLTDGTFTSSTGPMTVTGGVTLTGGSFEGAGTVDQFTVYRGTVAPGTTAPGVLSVAGAVAFNPLTTFSVLLDGTHVGGGYSRLRAAGPVQLGGSTLQLVLGFEPPVGRAFKILTGAAAGDIQGTFAGLPEGAIFSQGGYQFQITYQGGANGRGVVLTRLA